MAVQRSTNISVIAVQLAKIIGEVEPYMEAEIDRSIYLRFRETIRPSFYGVGNFLLRPLQIFYGGPPAGYPVRNKWQVCFAILMQLPNGC